MTITSLPFVLRDNAQKKLVQVQFTGIPAMVTVWSGAAYDTAGDYTEAQLETAVKALIGSDPAAYLESLFAKANAARAASTPSA